MRIAMFLDGFPRPTETFILSQITGLIERGHVVDLFPRWRVAYDQVHGDVQRFGLFQRACFLDPDPKNVVRRGLEAVGIVARNPEWLAPNGRALVRRIAAARRAGERHNLLNLVRLGAYGLKHRYDVIHCQYGTLGRLVLPLMQLGVIDGRLVTSIRGHDVTDRARTDSGYQALFRACGLFLPVSQSLAQRLVDLGCPADKIEVHHSGIDCSRFPYEPRAGLAGEPLRIVSVARFVEMKGLRYGIEAVGRLVRAGHDVHYQIVGDGPLRANLERQIAELNLQHRVELLGWRAQEALIPLLQRAHLFLAPSVVAANGEAEGIPNSVKEAMALGLPVVATWHSGIPELVQDGVSGYLVPERDVDALADRLARLCDQPSLWAQFGMAGRAHVEREFDRNALNDRLAELYAGAVPRRFMPNAAESQRGASPR